jgi:serine/threonine-protein kinase RsbW
MTVHILEKIPSRVELIPLFIVSFIDKLGTLPFLEEELFNLKLSLGEALANAMKHGNRFDPDKFVDIEIKSETNRLIMKVHDQGQGFDPKEIPDPTSSDALIKNSGRGIFLIRKLMDQVSFFDCGRGIEMVKFIKGGKP